MINGQIEVDQFVSATLYELQNLFHKKGQPNKGYLGPTWHNGMGIKHCAKKDTFPQNLCLMTWRCGGTDRQQPVGKQAH